VIAPKLHPQAVALVAQTITDSGANIVRVIRTLDEPVSMCFTISDVDKTAIEAALAGVSFEDATSVTVKAL
jgi:hypothetical protein